MFEKKRGENTVQYEFSIIGGPSIGRLKSACTAGTYAFRTTSTAEPKFSRTNLEWSGALISDARHSDCI